VARGATWSCVAWLIAAVGGCPARLRRRPCLFVPLSVQCFSTCFSLCFLDLIFPHHCSKLMFDGGCRRKLESTSKPKRVHCALLSLRVNICMTGQKTQCDRVETLEREARCRNQSRTFADGNGNQFRKVFDHTAENGRWANSTDLVVLGIRHSAICQLQSKAPTVFQRIVSAA
jgi:hypothetical protein